MVQGDNATEPYPRHDLAEDLRVLLCRCGAAQSDGVSVRNRRQWTAPRMGTASGAPWVASGECAACGGGHAMLQRTRPDPREASGVRRAGVSCRGVRVSCRAGVSCRTGGGDGLGVLQDLGVEVERPCTACSAHSVSGSPAQSENQTVKYVGWGYQSHECK